MTNEDIEINTGGYQYRMAWRNRKTGTEGRGYWLHDAEAVCEWIEEMETALPDTECWIQQRIPQIRLDKAA
jgi:hypothetical protein